MADLVASGRIAELIVAVLVVELVALLLLRRFTGRGPAAADVVFALAAGLGLALALAAALHGADWVWIAASLVFALIAHVADLVRRWPRGR
jgi:hypothetical protein